jgi:hypothetical protein
MNRDLKVFLFMRSDPSGFSLFGPQLWVASTCLLWKMNLDPTRVVYLATLVHAYAAVAGLARR